MLASTGLLSNRALYAQHVRNCVAVLKSFFERNVCLSPEVFRQANHLSVLQSRAEVI